MWPATGAFFTSYTMPYDAVGGIDYDTTTNLLWTADSSGTLRATNPNTGATISSISPGPQLGIGFVGGRLFTGVGGTITERNKTTGAVINSFNSVSSQSIGALAGVPEPSALALLALLAPATSLRRRRR